MKAHYALWMSVLLRNQYFLGDKGRGIAVVPNGETKRRLADARMLVKCVDNTLLIIAETDGAGKPKVKPAGGTRSIFYLDLVDPWVMSVSNVDLDALRRGRFYFSNRAANTVGVAPNQSHHLSLPLPFYNAAQAYAPGVLVAKSGHAFECVQASTGNDPELPNSPFWVDKGEDAFVSSADLISLRPLVSHFQLQSAASVFQVHVYGLDTATNAYDELVYQGVIDETNGESVDVVLVDLSHLYPARYRVEINGENFEAFFDDGAKARNPFGIVELFHDLDPADPYSAVDGAGVLREVEYTIALANRRAYWKYLTPQHQVSDIKISGAHGDPSPFTAGPSNDYYLSNVPLGLSETPGSNLFDLIVSGDARPAPRPDPAMPGVLTHTFDEVQKTWHEPVFNIRLNL